MKALRLVQQKGRLPLIRREQLRLLCAETSCVVQFDAAAAQRLIYRRRGVRALGGPCLFTFLHPIYYICPSFSPSLLVVTQIRGHTAGSCPPLPTRVRALHSYLENISALSSLVDSRRIVLTHAIIGALDSWCTFLRERNSVHVRRFESMTSTLYSAVRGYH